MRRRVGMAAAIVGAALWSGAGVAQEVTTEIYGDFRYSYNYADSGDASYWTTANNASRFGARGSVAARGLTAFVDLQVGVGVDEPPAFAPRYYLAGLRGGFGTLTIGRHSPAYKAVGLRLDPFYDTSSLSVGGGVPVTGLFAAASFGLSPLNNGFAGGALAYATPALYGFTGNAAGYVDPGSDHDYGVGLSFAARGVDLGVQYFDAQGSDTWLSLSTPAATVDDAIRGHLAYVRPSEFSLGVSLERVESEAGAHQDYLYAVGTAQILPATMVAGSFGHVGDGGAIQPISGNAFTAGLFHTLLPQTRVHLLYTRLDPDTGLARSNVAAGFTYQFLLRP